MTAQIGDAADFVVLPGLKQRDENAGVDRGAVRGDDDEGIDLGAVEEIGVVAGQQPVDGIAEVFLHR